MIPPIQYPGPQCPEPGEVTCPEPSLPEATALAQDGFLPGWGTGHSLPYRKSPPTRPPAHREWLGPPAKMKPIALGPMELGSS